jgi:hypothetical protein
MVVAWRIARLMRLGRTCPELNAQLMFEPDEWRAAFILNKKKPPDKPPTLNEVVRLVARLGGFLARTGDGESGVKTIWLGMQRILDFAAGVRFSRELQAAGSCICFVRCETELKLMTYKKVSFYGEAQSKCDKAHEVTSTFQVFDSVDCLDESPRSARANYRIGKEEEFVYHVLVR